MYCRSRVPTNSSCSRPKPHRYSTARPLELPEDLLSPKSDDDVVLDTRDTAPARVRKWKRSLLDLSTRNRLLNLKPSTQVIDLVMPSSGLALLDDLAHAGKPITLVANDELSSIHQLQRRAQAGEIDPELLLTYLRDDHKAYATVTRETYTKRFKELSRTARTMFEETGSSNLYLTLGALVHRTSTGVEARAPLFLLPVKIAGGTGRSPFRFEVDTTGVASPNYCLVEWLRLKHNVSIEALESPKLDESGIDIVHSLRDIRAGLVENRLDLRIDEVATISICQFGTFGMWKDLSDHWNLLEQSPIVRHLTHSAGESFRDPSVVGEDSLESAPVDESDVPVPIPADGSQLRAVAMAAEGRTFVLEGPPGTGKSQTITNLIAHALSRGKTVLFVAEKQAALDVVKKRLARVGLSDFTLDLHGKNQSANAIREQLRRAIDNTLQYNEFGWSARLAEFRSRHAPLDDYPGRIHRRNGIDDSLWRAHEAALTVGDGPSAPVPAAFVAHPDRCSQRHFRRTRELRTCRQVGGGTPRQPLGHRRQHRRHQHGGPDFRSRASRRQRPGCCHGRCAGLEVARVCSTIRTNLPPCSRTRGARSAVLFPTPAPWSGGAVRIMPPPATRYSRKSIACTRTALPCSRHSRRCSSSQATSTRSSSMQRKARKASSGRRSDSISSSTISRPTPSPARTSRRRPCCRCCEPSPRHGHTSPNSATRCRVRSARTRLRTGIRWPPTLPPHSDRRSSTSSATAEFAEREPNSWARLTQAGFPSNTVMAVLEEVDAAWREWRRVLGTHADDLARWKQDEHWTIAWQRDASTWRQEIEEAGGRVDSSTGVACRHSSTRCAQPDSTPSSMHY